MRICAYCMHSEDDWRHVSHVNELRLTNSQRKALQILDDCKYRRGIKHEFEEVDDEVIMEILQDWSRIISGNGKEMQGAAKS